MVMRLRCRATVVMTAAAVFLLWTYPIKAQDATPLPGVIVESNKPPPPISVPSSRDPGPAAQARKPEPRTVAAVPSLSTSSPDAAPAGSDGSASTSDSNTSTEPAAPTVVTPNRTPQTVGSVASAITVIGPTELERARNGGATFVDVLRGTPGVNVRRSGGPGGTTDVRIRGADSDQTLVMIDGIPVNDPASAQGEFDFSVISLANVERVEILRGPQSGVYGGDAIGGVINIITRTGKGPPSGFAEVEGGSFGTTSQRAGMSGSVGRFSYSLGATNYYSSGFSRRDVNTEDDFTRKQAVVGSFGLMVNEALSLSARLGYSRLRAEIDGSSANEIPERANRELWDGAITATLNPFGDSVVTTATVFANRTTREFLDCSSRTADCGSFTNSDFEGTRVGLETKSVVKLRDGLDQFTFGGRLQEISGSKTDTRSTGTIEDDYDVSETHRAVYASYALNPISAFTVTASGRLDDFGDEEFHGTYRFAAAYRFDATSTKFRASYGTGVKAPTIFQRFDATFGNDSLDIETSKGFDFGIDQQLLGGRFEVSATYFQQDIDNLIVFTGDFFTGTYENVESVETSGVEVALEWRITDWLRLRGTYTYLDAINGETNARLRRRPEHTAKGTVAVQPFAGTYIAATVVYQSAHFNRDFDPANPDADLQRVKGFTRLDLDADFTIDKRTTFFVKAENLTDVDYQEVRGFNTPGRSAYAGVRLRF
ncbi:MAG: TonB-dependent receptor [Pseudomonadota bacterium]